MQLSKRKEFHKENYSLVFESANLQVPHVELRQRYRNVMRSARIDAYVKNSNRVGRFIRYTVYLHYRIYAISGTFTRSLFVP